jgi:transposase
MLDHKFEPNASAAHRIEVFTGTGRRRRWSSDAKARIVEETLAAGTVASEVARRHGISPQQLFGWRRAALRPAIAGAASPPGFAAVMLEAPVQKRTPEDGAVLEIIVGAMVARIPLSADRATLAKIVGALKGAS